MTPPPQGDISTPDSDFYLNVARGAIQGVSFINKFGQNPDIDIAADEDIWDQGGDYDFPTQARIHDIASTDAADDLIGTGARTVEIFGLDSNYNEISEIIDMDGLTDVPTTNSYLRMHRMIVRSAGSGDKSAGNITATAQTDATVTAQITNGNNQTLMAIYTIPNGKTGCITNVFFSVGKKTAAAADVEFLVRPLNEVFQNKMPMSGNTQGKSHVQHKMMPYEVVDAKSDIKMRASVTANDAVVSGGFGIIMTDT